MTCSYSVASKLAAFLILLWPSVSAWAVPVITQQPQNQSASAGATVTFTVRATGVGLVEYLWFFNGNPLANSQRISGAESATLTIRNVTASDAGQYAVAIADDEDVVGSSVATLTVTAGPTPGPGPGGTRWIVLIYGHADHNLSQSLVVDMQEMEAVGSGPGFNIVLQADFDASSQDTLDRGLPADQIQGVSRYLIQKDADPTLISSKPVERLPESLNMDDPLTLAEFIVWGAQKYPADRYGLVLWNHGGQWAGFGGDSQDGTLQDKGTLLTAQIREALAAAMKATGIVKWEFVAFDTCLMGGAEVLTDFAPLTDVFLACAEIDFGDGWEYEASLGFLKANPAAAPLDFARQEAKAWEAHHMQPGKEADLALAAHAVYDLTRYAAFEQKLNAFGALLRQAAAADNLILPRIRRDTTQYSIEDVRAIGQPTDYIDVGEFAARLATDVSTAAPLKSAANELIQSINAMVVTKVVGSRKKGTLGVSIYYPTEGKKNHENYKALALSSKGGGAWAQFLEAVGNVRAQDAEAPVVEEGEELSLGLAGAGDSQTLTASRLKPAVIPIKVTKGADAYGISAALVNNQFTTKTNEFVYLGEVAAQPASGEGKYTVTWNATLPVLSSSAGPEAAFLGAFFEDIGSDILVSFADYIPPGAKDAQPVLLLSEIAGNTARITQALDAEVEDLAPQGIALKPGGKLTPFYYMERRSGEDPDKWESFEVLANTSIVIPPNGLDGLRVDFQQVPDGLYSLEIQVEDVYENESEVLEFAVRVGEDGPRLRFELLSSNRLKLQWPAAATDFVLEANNALSATGWTVVPAGQITTEGGQKTFTDNPASQSRFYRLKQRALAPQSQ